VEKQELTLDQLNKVAKPLAGQRRYNSSPTESSADSEQKGLIGDSKKKNVLEADTRANAVSSGTKFGFFVQLYNKGPAAEKLVTEIRASYPGQTVYYSYTGPPYLLTYF
jgi:hypothetical protein